MESSANMEFTDWRQWVWTEALPNSYLQANSKPTPLNAKTSGSRSCTMAPSMKPTPGTCA
eukprot:CAMPEP_0115261640 /NCGR_PEP_ID=MMETSP0270-20121206/48966_1 /TAXON_ID=71861 /ORGANISM="Scrippsiella trochoidea, Strain CCMP3099" /LENGTH=59 /DNA_ID=CAMNT_0002677531 /DNA_START=292 /DNA_END=471 /DNA_ORIENTATION=+